MKLWKGVTKQMADKQQPPKPPKMTRAEWGKRSESKVTLTKTELEYLAQMIAAGRVLIRDNRSVPPLLKAAMTRLGVSTQGL
jgi:hypothetical protein